MATSFWTLCNPNIRVETTTKKFFGKFLYKLVVYVAGGRSIDSRRGIEESINHRRSQQHLHTGSWWWQHRNPNLEKANIDLLKKVKELKDNRKNLNILVRIEEPHIQIYSESLDQLEKIVCEYFNNYQTLLTAISWPASELSAEVLNSGAIIRRSDIGHSHKIILRDGKYSREVKESILNYLESLGDEIVKIPPSLSGTLTRSSSYIWNGYFYTSEPNIVSFLNLMDPNLVLNIHELVVLPHK